MTLHLVSAPAAAPTFLLGDHVEVASEYARSFGPEAVFDDGALFTYESGRGLYCAKTDAEESRQVQEYSGSPIVEQEGGKPKALKLSAPDVSGIVKLAHARLTKHGFFANAPPGLAFADRFVKVTSDGILAFPHGAINRARYGYPFAYVKGNRPKKFYRFLADVFARLSRATENEETRAKNDADVVARIALLQEFAGAALLGVASKYQLCLVLEGAGANGKSTLIAILKSVFPPGTVVAVPPQRWEDQYRRATLAGALLNAVSELPENDILASETFKAVISGDEIEARHIYKPLFHFTPRAGHLFGANRLPASNDTTHGFWRRFAVLRFERRFEGEQADPDLAAKIIATEKAEIVSWMLAGAHQLMKRGHYIIPQSSRDALAAWKRNSNPVALFVDERLSPIKDGDAVGSAGTIAKMLHKAFTDWATENGHKGLSSVRFGGRLRDLGYEPKKTNSGWFYPLKFAANSGDKGDEGVTETRHRDSGGGANA